MKYNNKLPNAKTVQTVNSHLKEIGRIAGINETIVLNRTVGGAPTKRTGKKWQFITPHTARRSFATNAFKSGIPSQLIMRITGHKTEENFLKYIKVSEEEAAFMISQFDFFKD